MEEKLFQQLQKFYKLQKTKDFLKVKFYYPSFPGWIGNDFQCLLTVTFQIVTEEIWVLSSFI